MPDDAEAVLLEMKGALADAITKWAELEDALALLLSEVLGPEPYGPLIYFAPVATATRFSIVGAVLSLYLKSDPRLWQFCDNWARSWVSWERRGIYGINLPTVRSSP